MSDLFHLTLLDMNSKQLGRMIHITSSNDQGLFALTNDSTNIELSICDLTRFVQLVCSFFTFWKR